MFTAGHGLTGPPCKVGGSLAVVFGVTNPSALLLLAASDARIYVRFFHLARLAAAPILQVHTIDGAFTLLHGHFSLIALTVLALRYWGLGTPPPSMKRAGG